MVGHLGGGEIAKREGIGRRRRGTRGDMHRSAKGLTGDEIEHEGGAGLENEGGGSDSGMFGRREGKHHVERGEENPTAVTAWAEEQQWRHNPMRMTFGGDNFFDRIRGNESEINDGDLDNRKRRMGRRL